MMGLNPLAWSNLAFNWVYFAALLALVAASFVIVGKLRPAGSKAKLTHPGEFPILRGQVDRFAECHIVHLLEQGALAMEDGKLVRRGRIANPTRLESALLELPSPLRWRAVRRVAGREARTVIDSLVKRGLLMGRGEALRIGLISCLPLLALFALGWWRLQASETPGFLGSTLWVLVWVTALVTLPRLFGVERYTKAGKEYWGRARLGSARLKQAATTSELQQAVALYGTSALEGSPLAAFHEWRKTFAGGSNSGSDTADIRNDGNAGSAGGCGGGGCGGGGD